jgi:hypothetical protein
MYKKLLLTILLSLSLTCCFAEGQARVYPPEGLQTFLGLDDTSSPPIVKDGRAADLQNITLDITGAVSKRNGYSFHSLLDTVALTDDFEAVTGLHEIYKSNGTRIKIATCGDKLFAITSAGVKTDITSGVTITEGKDKGFSWITALDYGIGTNNVDPPIKTTGLASGTSALSFTGLSSAITDAKCAIWWKNYLIFGNTTEAATVHSTRIRWSNVGTIETWSDDDYVDIAALGGQQIEGFATLYDNLIIFLTDSIYKVSLVGGDELINVSKISEGIGCIAKNSIQNIQIGNSEGLVFLSRDKTINFCDGTSVTEISTNISGVMDNLSSARLPYAVSVDDQENAHYYLAAATSSTNNLLLDFHYGIGEWSKHTQIDANAFCIANDTNEKPQIYYGNFNSIVYQMVDPDKDSDVGGKIGTITSTGTYDTATATGQMVLYDTSASFTNVTGGTVSFTSGTGVNTEAIITSAITTGVMVTGTNVTATTGTTYSIGAIDAYYTTKWYDTGSAPLRKNFGELFLWGSADTSVNMQIYYATDFSSTISSTNVALGGSGSLWGTAIWGTSTWSGSQTDLTRIPLNVSGRYIKYKFSEDSIDEPMTLYGYSTLLWNLDYL